MPPRLIVTAGYGEPDSRALFSELAKIPRPPAFNVLGNINGALEINLPGTHAALLKRFVSRACVARALAKNPDVPLDDLVVCSRITMLLLLKLAFATDSVGAPSQDMSLLGELALRVNDFHVGSRFRGPLRTPTDDDVMLEALSAWDVSNPTDLRNGLARASRMLRQYWSDDDQVVREHQRRLSVTRTSAIFDGATLEEYFSALFGV